MPYRMFQCEESIGLVSNPKTLFKEIKILSQYGKSEKNYKCFSIFDLYKDIFRGDDETPPLIPIPGIPSDHKGVLMLLLPPEMMAEIEKSDNIKKSGSNNNLAGFFQYSVNDNKIRDLLFESLSNMGWKDFIEKIQLHIIRNLEGADLSANADFSNYLSSVGNRIIVPSNESSEANKEFINLLSKFDDDSLKLIVANFFISCLIGLRAMNYEKDNYTTKYPSKKTYLLSEYGMECIWRPDLITPPRERIDEARQMHKSGNYALAYKLGKQWLTEYEIRASKEELALAYQTIGFSLCKFASSDDNEYKYRFSEGIDYLKKCVYTGEADPSVFYYLYDYLKANCIKEATEYLKTAFAQNYAKAVIEVASLYLDGVYIFDDVTEESLLKKINHIIENERRNDVVDVGKSLYLHGRFAKKHGNEEKANEDFEAASKRGNERARQEIARKKRNERNSFPAFINDENAPCCYANTFTGNNYTTVSTFPSEIWVMYIPDNTDKKGIIGVSGIEEFIESQVKAGFPHSRLVFLLMSEDEEKNLNECLILLDKLFNIVLDKSKEEKWRIIDAIDIFVSAKYETASMLIDANISDMGSDIYFKVHITDENRDTVHKLLCEAPLFLPVLKKGNCKTEVVLFGSSEMNYNFIKESIACTYLGSSHAIKITLLGENADTLENRLHQECPGIYSDNPLISCIRPVFIKCSIKDTDFPNYIYGKIYDQVLGGKCEDSFDTEIVNALRDANYFVVDYSDDLEDIKFAAELRTWLLRSKGSFNRAPFIGVKCSDEQNSYLASHLTLSGQASGNSYFNKYDLFPVGISAQIYSYENMIKNPVLNDFALRIHKSYYGDNERAAENDFYSYSYNADSSLSTAIGLCYRFFAAGVLFNDKDNYLNFGFFKTPDIEIKFEEVYKEKLEVLAALEQSRWNGFMLCRGWESANKSEVRAYREQSTGLAHKHVLAKKHPFIREWEDLDAPKLTELLDILKSKFDYDRQPQVTTKKSIKDTAKFFNVTEKTTEKSH